MNSINPAAASSPIEMLVAALLLLFIIAGAWKVYSKAGRPGIFSLIPIFNMVVLCQICGLSGWYALLLLVPIVNILFGFYLMFRLALAFGKGFGFTLGLIFFPFIFLLILGFGSATYVGVQKQ